jgi:hypothetical protein
VSPGITDIPRTSPEWAAQAVSPFQRQAHLRRSKAKGNSADDALLSLSLIMLIVLNILEMSQSEFLRRALSSIAVVPRAHALGFAAPPGLKQLILGHYKVIAVTLK